MIDGQIFNVGYENHTVAEIAETIRDVVGNHVDIVTTPTDDNRSYHICSGKIQRVLGYVPRRTIRDAAADLLAAFRAGRVPDAMSDDRYFNVKTLQSMKAP